MLLQAVCKMTYDILRAGVLGMLLQAVCKRTYDILRAGVLGMLLQAVCKRTLCRSIHRSTIRAAQNCHYIFDIL
jgi:hypothetical protein